MEILNFKLLLSCFVAFVALVNPIQKVFVITYLQKQFDLKSTRTISIKASITALIILLLFYFVGHVLLNYVFRIELYAFQIQSDEPAGKDFWSDCGYNRNSNGS
ncbi:MAG: MarC family protein [Rikenellaceae bacterium]